MPKNKVLIGLSTLFYCLFLFLLLGHTKRTDSLELMVLYGGSFVCFLSLYTLSEKTSFQSLVISTSILIGITFLFSPSLSTDYFRFLWDGELIWRGINPFDLKPNELISTLGNSAYLNQLYVGMGELSQHNYSCYPPVNQLYFSISTGFSDSITTNLLVMRLSILLSVVVGSSYLVKLLNQFNLPTQRIWLLLLNPLFIIETFGNIHFEAVMISFFIIGFYFLFNNKWILGALFFALAIQIKLIPLIFLPFFLRYLGWKKSILFYILIGSIVVLVSLFQLDTKNYMHFFQSLQLYFKVFEFNSSFFYFLLEYGQWTYGWNLSNKYGPLLSRYAFLAIISLAWYGFVDHEKKLFYRLTIAIFIYLLLSTTLHPWYLLTILCLSLFTPFKFTVMWTATVFLSYLFYNPLFKEYKMLITVLEYLPVITLFIIEIYRGRKYFSQSN
jgi:alpha-1,6-mannosyltransferase